MSLLLMLIHAAQMRYSIMSLNELSLTKFKFDSLIKWVFKLCSNKFVNFNKQV